MADNFIISYIVMAHNRPQQLGRLLRKLNGPGCRFFIHIDKGVDIKPFLDEIDPGENMQFVPEEYREYTPWGEAGFVRATLNALRLLGRDKSKGYTVLLSGQDYPVKSNRYIRRYLQNHDGTCFISTFPLPSDRWTMGGLPRLTHYRIDRSQRRGDFYTLPSIHNPQFFTIATLRGILALMASGKFRFLLDVLKRRRFPKYLSPCGGSTWWAFPSNTSHKLCSFVDDHPDLLKFFAHSHCPDEMFFQSIIRQWEKEGKVKEIKDSLTYVNWEKKGVPLPVTFSAADFDELNGLGAHFLFARKFDAEADTRILDLVDKEIIPRW